MGGREPGTLTVKARPGQLDSFVISPSFVPPGMALSFSCSSSTSCTLLSPLFLYLQPSLLPFPLPPTLALCPSSCLSNLLSVSYFLFPSLHRFPTFSLPPSSSMSNLLFPPSSTSNPLYLAFIINILSSIFLARPLSFTLSLPLLYTHMHTYHPLSTPPGHSFPFHHCLATGSCVFLMISQVMVVTSL